MLTPAQPVPPAAGVIRVNCAPQLLLRRGKGHGRLFVGGRKWDEAQDRFRNVGIIAAIALLIFACNFFNGRELRDFVGARHVGGDARSLFIAGIHTHVLDVVCLLASVAEVFDHFVVSVIERLSATDESAVRAVETVLQRWRQFLIAPSGPPGRNRLAEILSELLVVSDAVQASGVPRIGFWVGPFGARHDMRCGSTAVEVILILILRRSRRRAPNSVSSP